MSSHAPRPSTQRIALMLLLAVLVLAQTVGWMHRGLHGTSSPAMSTSAAPHVHAPSPAGSHSWIHALFGSHTDGSDCRLFDVLGQPGCASAAMPSQALLPMATLLVNTHAGFVARWAALFDARGPPASR